MLSGIDMVAMIHISPMRIKFNVLTSVTHALLSILLIYKALSTLLLPIFPCPQRYLNSRQKPSLHAVFEYFYALVCGDIVGSLRHRRWGDTSML